MILKLTIKLSVFALFLIIALFLTRTKANAESIIESQQQIINLDNSNNASIYLKIQIRNNHEKNLVGGYEIALPYLGVSEVVGKLNDINIPTRVEANAEGTLSHIIMDFSGNILRPGESKKVEVFYKAGSFLRQNNGLSYLAIHQIDHSIDIVNTVDIHFPTTFGKPSLVSTNNYEYVVKDLDISTLSTTGDQSFLVMWGDSYEVDLKSDFTLERSNPETTSAIINLAEESSNQNITYKTIKDGERGFYDQYGNNFYEILFNNENKIYAGFEARLRKNNILEDKFNQTYNYQFNKDSDFGSILQAEFNTTDDNERKLRLAYEYIINNLIPSSNDENDLSINEDLWENPGQYKDNAPSFYYAALLASIAEGLDYKVNIKYGYALFPGSSAVKKPHFWLELKDNQDIFIIDPYLSDLRKIEYYKMNSSLDRVSFGSFSTNQNYNTYLGLLKSNNVNVSIELSELGDFENKQPNVSMNYIIPEIKSGFNSNGTIIFKNLSNDLLKINSLMLGDLEIIDSTIVGNLLYPSILPNTETTVELFHFREPNFFKLGKINTKLTAYLDSKVITNEKEIEYIVNKNLFIVTMIGISATFLYLGFIIRRRKIRNGKSYQYL